MWRFKAVINRFVILWGLISPLCIGLIASVLKLNQIRWFPAYYDIWISLTIYLIYWIIVGILQAAAIFWKFHAERLAYKWFFTTSITGFVVMFLHDFILLKVLGADTRGQGLLVLIVTTLPCLAVLGGLILGYCQLRLIRNYYKANRELNYLNILWLFINVILWVICFAGIFISSFSMLALIIFPFVSIIKGWLINEYLRKQVRHY